MKLRSLLILSFFISICFALAQTPEATVQKFADLISKKDVDGAAALVKNGHVLPEVKKQMLQGTEWPTLTLSNITAKVEGKSAAVTYSIHTTGIGDVKDHAESLELAKVGEAWLIISPKNPGTSKDDTLLPAIAYFFANMQGAAQTVDAAKATSCLSNVKQLALGTLMFAGDYDDVLKTTSAKWKTSIYPYTKNEAIFTCPEAAKGTVSYTFNARLANIKMSKIKDPAKTVLIYEGSDGKLNYRHDGRAAVAFADGHAKLINKEQAKTLVWKP